MFKTALLTIAALALASCATGESTTPGLERDAEPVGRLPAPTTVEIIADTVPPLPETTPSTVAATSTDAATITPAPTSEPAATEPALPAPTAEMTCNSLQTDGYETRKNSIAAVTDAGLKDVEATCADALAELRAARSIEDRMTAFNAAGDGLVATNLVCDEGTFSLDVTNNVDHPIGVHAALQLQAEGDPAPIGSTLEPLVSWSLEPGATQSLTGIYRLTRESDAALTCQVDLTAFDASPGTADASLTGDPRQPELAGNDPSLWLPSLVSQGAAIPGSNIPDAAAAVEDVRSSAYGQVLAGVTATVDQQPPSVTISVCSASIDRPDDRTISLVYFAEPTDATLDFDSVLQHGIFRRGNDGQWRWLTNSKYFDSRDYWDCGTPSVNN